MNYILIRATENNNENSIDVVYIGTLNNTHLEVGILMLDGGKHVLCRHIMFFCAKLKTNIILIQARSH